MDVYARPDLHFDPSYLLEGVRPSYDHVEPEPQPERPDHVYPGKRVRWIGEPGVMMKIPSAYVLPTMENTFYARHFAALYQQIANGERRYIEAPPARINTVTPIDVRETHEAVRDHRLDELWMTRPWERWNLGHTYVRLQNGNHHTFAAILAGEPHVWVYVLPNYRDEFRAQLR